MFSLETINKTFSAEEHLSCWLKPSQLKRAVCLKEMQKIKTLVASSKAIRFRGFQRVLNLGPEFNCSYRKLDANAGSFYDLSHGLKGDAHAASLNSAASKASWVSSTPNVCREAMQLESMKPPGTLIHDLKISFPNEFQFPAAGDTNPSFLLATCQPGCSIHHACAHGASALAQLHNGLMVRQWLIKGSTNGKQKT